MKKIALAPYAAALVAMIALFAIGAGRAFALERELYFLRASGWGAVIALLAALSASPIARAIAFARRRALDVAPLRRALGITAAALATLHGALAVTSYLEDAWRRALDVAWIRGGTLAWCILAALWITSYPRLVRAMRVQLWKPLHRLAYVAALFAFQHAILSPLAPRAWVLIAFAIPLAIAPLRLLPRRARDHGTSGASGSGP